MTRVLYWSMYVTSTLIGYVLGGVLLACGWRFATPVRELVEQQAREHAEQAARREGSYLAPVTFAVALAAVTVLGIAVIRWAS